VLKPFSLFEGHTTFKFTTYMYSISRKLLTKVYYVGLMQTDMVTAKLYTLLLIGIFDDLC